MSSWVGSPGRRPYVIPRWSAGLKKSLTYCILISPVKNCNFSYNLTVSTAAKCEVLHTPNYCLADKKHSPTNNVLVRLKSSIPLSRNLLYAEQAKLRSYLSLHLLHKLRKIFRSIACTCQCCIVHFSKKNLWRSLKCIFCTEGKKKRKRTNWPLNNCYVRRKLNTCLPVVNSHKDTVTSTSRKKQAIYKKMLFIHHLNILFYSNLSSPHQLYSSRIVVEVVIEF